jgi:hypothetical protein
MAYNGPLPQVVNAGGSGAATLTGVLIGNGTSAFTGNAVTQHDVLVGGASNAITSVAPSATSGVALISQGAAADPAFGTVVVAGGGTGAVTLTGVLTGNGTSAVTASTVTQYDVLVGGATNAVGSVGPGTSGQILQSGGNAANPAYSTTTYPSTNAINTIMYASSANVLGSIAASANGVLISSATNVPSWLAAGTTGQILTATTGSPATWASPATATITITGDTGGALSNSSFTFTGGTTGLKFGGSGSTETVSGTLAIANGGSNATSFTQSNGIVTYNGTRLVNYAGPQLSSGGVYTNTSQPCFNAVLSASTSANVTGDGTTYTVLCDTIGVNQGTNYSAGTGIFTAPVTGTYIFSGSVNVAPTNLSVAYTQGFIQIATSSQTYISGLLNYGVVFTTATGVCQSISVVAKMSANDTASLQVRVSGSTKSLGVEGGIGSTFFSGCLLC